MVIALWRNKSNQVAAGMITAKEKNIKLDFRKACELDLNEKQTLHVSSEEKKRIQIKLE